jgi:hypothetical protein
MRMELPRGPSFASTPTRSGSTASPTWQRRPGKFRGRLAMARLRAGPSVRRPGSPLGNEFL